jgi:Phosphodiester glycosidase
MRLQKADLNLMNDRPLAHLCLLLILGGCSGAPKPVTTHRVMHEMLPRTDTVWPWPDAVSTTPHAGVTRWFAVSQDKTELELMQFDFKSNPRLRFELYDQDEDSVPPYRDDADYVRHGVGAIVKHLNNQASGQVVAAWNGLFFSYSGGPGKGGSHIGPTVIAGKAHYNVGSIRWAFGVSYKSGHPEFKVIHEPDIHAMERALDYGAIGAQCLIKDGAPLRLQPFPLPDAAPLRTPVPSTEQEVGHIPRVDFIWTSRTSMGWSKDNRYLYLLVVNAPETETESWLAMYGGSSAVGGWSLRDLQNFWKTFGAWGAVNSDGGILTQFCYELPDGRYSLLPSRAASSNKRLILEKDLNGAPGGGSMMTFYVRDSS